MSRGRKKQEIETGYVKEKFVVDIVLKEDELKRITEKGKSKYICDLVKKDLSSVKESEENYTLTVTDEIRDRFNNDPRRAYLLGQLLTEFYYNVKSESLVDIIGADEPSNNVVKDNAPKVVNDVPVATKKEVIVEETTAVDIEIEENIEEEYIEVKKEVVAEEKVESVSNVQNNDDQEDSRVGRLNTSPLMKKRLGSKK